MLRSVVQFRRHVGNAVAGTGSSGLETGNQMHGSYHWIYDRILSGASLATVTYGVLTGPSNTLDVALAVVLPLHCHIGFQTIIDDYLPQRKFNVVYKVARGSLLLATALTLYGAYRFNTENIGISEAAAELWKSKVFYKEVSGPEYED